MNINMHINIEDGCRHGLHMGALPPNPHAFGGTGFFYAGGGYHSHFKPPANLKPFHYPLPPPGAQALLQAGLSPFKRSSSRARVPQGLLKPSSRRVKESLKKCSPK